MTYRVKATGHEHLVDNDENSSKIKDASSSSFESDAGFASVRMDAFGMNARTSPCIVADCSAVVVGTNNGDQNAPRPATDLDVVQTLTPRGLVGDAMPRTPRRCRV